MEKNLLFLQSEKANIKIKELAGLLKKSSQRLKYSINSLVKESIIHDPFCIFDYSYFGMILFRVYFKGAYASETDKVNIIKQLSDNKRVVAIYEMTGEFDFVVEIEAKNPSRFNKELRDISNNIPTLSHYKILLNVVTFLYPRLYLTENKIFHSLAPQINIGGDRDLCYFNEKEMSVMKNLLENPKLRIASLAKLSDLNVKTVKKVLKDLHKKNIIKGFKYQIDTNKLDINNFRLYLNLHNLSNERESDLLKYLKDTKEIVLANKTVGDWDLEIDIESPNRTRIRKLVIEFREVFKDIIENFNIMEFYGCYKKTYLPKHYFEE